eukprot:Polyplicarium_translucidae@DN2549_c0_g1_i1.p1
MDQCTALEEGGTLMSQGEARACPNMTNTGWMCVPGADVPLADTVRRCGVRAETWTPEAAYGRHLGFLYKTVQSLRLGFLSALAVTPFEAWELDSVFARLVEPLVSVMSRFGSALLERVAPFRTAKPPLSRGAPRRRPGCRPDAVAWHPNCFLFADACRSDPMVLLYRHSAGDPGPASAPMFDSSASEVVALVPLRGGRPSGVTLDAAQEATSTFSSAAKSPPRSTLSRRQRTARTDTAGTPSPLSTDPPHLEGAICLKWRPLNIAPVLALAFRDGAEVWKHGELAQAQLLAEGWTCGFWRGCSSSEELVTLEWSPTGSQLLLVFTNGIELWSAASLCPMASVQSSPRGGGGGGFWCTPLRVEAPWRRGEAPFACAWSPHRPLCAVLTTAGVTLFDTTTWESMQCRAPKESNLVVPRLSWHCGGSALLWATGGAVFELRMRPSVVDVVKRAPPLESRAVPLPGRPPASVVAAVVDPIISNRLAVAFNDTAEVFLYQYLLQRDGESFTALIGRISGPEHSLPVGLAFNEGYTGGALLLVKWLGRSPDASRLQVVPMLIGDSRG